MTENNILQYQSRFSDSSFWNKVKNVAKKAGAKLIYVALILYYELTDPTVSLKEKSVIIGALGYFILPFDLIPVKCPNCGSFHTAPHYTLLDTIRRLLKKD